MTEMDYLSSEHDASSARLGEATLDLLRSILPDASGLSLESSLSERRLSSLAAVRLRLEIKRRFSVDVSMLELSECDTPARLALLIAQRCPPAKTSMGPKATVPGPISDDAPAESFILTDVQQAYAMGKQSSMADDAIGCHLYREIEIEQLDCERLHAAWQRLVEHFDALRLDLTEDGRQRVRAHCHWEMPIHPTAQSTGGSDDATVERVRAELSGRGFKHGEWPLFRVQVSYARAGTSVVHLGVDGSLCDGVGLNLLLDACRRLYAEPSRPLEPAPGSLRSAIMALAARQTSAEYERDLGYWAERLDGCPGGPVFPRRSKQSTEPFAPISWRSISSQLDAVEWTNFRNRAAALDVSPTALALSIFAETLSHAGATHPFSIVLTTNYRPWLPSDAAEQVGPFTGTMILPIDFSLADHVDENARRLQQQLWGDLNHASVSSIAALRELRRRKKPIPKDLSVVFTSLVGATEGSAPVSDRTGWIIGRAASQTSGIRLDHQMWEADGKLHVQWDVTDGWLEPGAIDALACSFFRRLRASASLIGPPELRPLNELQKAYFVPRASDDGSPYNGCQAYFSFGVPNLSVARLEQALLRLIRSYDVLRTVIGSDGLLHVHAETPSRFEIPVVDLSAIADRDAALAALCREMVTSAYPLDRFPMFDVRVTRDGTAEALVHFCIDLAIADGMSLHLITRELLRLTLAEDPALAPRVAEPIAHHEREAKALRTDGNAAAYWQRRFEQMPPGPSLVRQAARRERIRLHAEFHDWAALKDVARANGVLPDLLFAASLGAAIQSSYPGKPFSLPVVRWLPDVARYRPCELTALTWVTDSGAAEPALKRALEYQRQISQDPPATAGSGLAELRKRVMQHRRHGEFSLPVVYTSVFDLSDYALPAGVRIGLGMTYTPDVSLDCISVGESDGTLQLFWDAVAADFEPGQLQAMFATYQATLGTLAGQEIAPRDTAAEQAPPASANEISRHTILHDWNDTERPFPDTRPAHHYFEDRARDQPHAIALDGREGPLTYGALNAHANRIAWHLKSLGVGPEVVVGIHIGRGHAMVAAVLGVLKAGGAYLPVDLAWPMERLKTVLGESKAALLLAEPTAQARAVAAGIERVIPIERDVARVFAGERSDDPPPTASVDNLAYIIFTSGSTGTPKGIAVAHRPVLNLLAWAYRTFDFGPKDKGLAVAALGFDLSVFDIFGLLGCGASFYVADEEEQKDPSLLVEILAHHGITFWNSAPAVLHQMAPLLSELKNRPRPGALRLVFLSGDYTPLSLPGALRSSFPNACIVNLGGATEATVWSNYYVVGEVDPAWRSIPYGKPIDNCRYYVLDDFLEPCPVGTEGDLFIAGAALSRGYVNRPVLTAQSFISDPFRGSSQELMYKTGDRASYYSDGNLNFLGRTDQQVKLRGFRVELGEIEHRLRALPSIRDALVLIRLDHAGDQKVVAYVTCRSRPVPTVKAIRSHAAEALPSYMVPNHVVFLDELPKTSNGKVDRNALPWPVADAVAAEPRPSGPTRDEIVEAVSSLCAGVLARSTVEPHQDLWDLGATSFDMVQVSGGLQRRFGCRVPVAALVEDATVASIARFLEKQLAPEATEGDPAPARSEAQAPALAAPADAPEVVDLLDATSVARFKAKTLHLRRAANERVTRLLSSRPTAKQAAARSSQRQFASGGLTLGQLADLLGKLSSAPGEADSKRLYPSAGSTYGVQVYVHAKTNGVDGLTAGIYYYHPEEHSLMLLSDARALQRGVHFQYNRSLFDAAAAEIYLIGQKRAVAPLYGEEEAEKFLFLEAGYIGQLLMMTQADLGIAMCPVGSLAFAKVRDDFCLDDGHAFLHAFFVGPSVHKEKGHSFFLAPKQRREEVAIVGVAGRYPGADTPDSLWRALCAGKRALGALPAARRKAFDSRAEGTTTPIGGFLEDIAAFDNLLFHVSPREAKGLDPQTRLSLEVARECLDDAGYTADSLNQTGRVGVFAAVMWHDYQQLGADAWLAGGEGIVAGLASDLANRLSYVFGFEGPSLAINTSCSSSLSALHAARMSLENGECDAALVVAVNLVTHPYHLGLLAQHGLLASSNLPCAFDAKSKGWHPGEGCGALLLRRADAASDRDDLRAILETTWVAHSGRAPRFAAPNSAGMARSIRRSLEAASVRADDIDYVECAAAGASLADCAEVEALESVFGDRAGTPLYLGTLKPNIGHLEAASGMSQLTKVLLQLRARRFAPTLVASPEDSLVPWQALRVRPVEAPLAWPSRPSDAPRRALVNAAGATGSYAHAVLREAPLPKRASSENLAERYVLLSAANAELLSEYGGRMLSFLRDAAAANASPRLDDIAFTCQVGRVAMPHRLAIRCRDVTELLASLDQFLKTGRHPAIRVSEAESVAEGPLAPETIEVAVAKWLQGHEIDWQRLWDGVARRTSLPSMPFVRERHWLDEQAKTKVPAPVDARHRERFERTLVELYAEVSGIQSAKIRANTPLDRYGLNSTLISELNQRLAQRFGSLPATLFFEHRDLASIANFLARRSDNTSERPERIPSSEEASREERFAIVGISGRYPGARDLTELWQALDQGRDQIRQIPESRRRPGWPIERMWGSFLDEVDRFDPLFFKISPRDAQLMSPEERLFLQVAWETVESAGYGRRRLRTQHGSRCGVFVGAMYNEYPFFAVEQGSRGHAAYAGSAPAGIANRVSYFLDLHGPSLVVDTMCSASLTALHLAVRSLQSGECELALVGGVNLCLHPNKFIQIDELKMSSSDHRCRSFGAGGDGFVPGEGVGALLLKPLSRALADSDQIHAVVLGTAINHGGKTNGYMVPNPTAQSDVVVEALRRAGVSPATIGYVEAHGTGTELGDPVELEGLTRAFATAGGGLEAGSCAVGSVKSVLGHLEAAAGIAGVTKVVQQMKQRRFAASLHAELLNSNIDWARSPFRVQRQADAWPALAGADGTPLPRRACVSAFGAGGSNAHVVLEEFDPPQRVTPRRVTSPQIFVLSARNRAGLETMAARLALLLRDGESAPGLDEVAFTLQVGRDAFRERLAIVASSHDELATALEQFARAESGIAIHGRAAEPTPSAPASSDLHSLARFWVTGGEADWESRWSGVKPRTATLPGYPFAEVRCWLPAEPAAPNIEAEAKATESHATLYEKRWQPAEHATAPADRAKGGVVCLFGAGSEAVASGIARAFQGTPVVLVREGDSIPADSSQAQTWIDLCDLAREPGAPDSWQARLGALQQWLTVRVAEARRVLHVTSAAHSSSATRQAPRGTQLAAIVRLLEAEVARLSARTMETDLGTQRPVAIADQILAELAVEDSPGEVSYRSGRRYVPALIQTAASATRTPTLRADATYLVTGGTRGLGALVARHLQERGARRLALVCASPVPKARESWDDPALTVAAKSAINTVRELERRGAQVMLHGGSIAETRGLREFLGLLRATWGRIAGIVHCAGRSSTGSPAFLRKTQHEFESAFEPKLDGLHALARACESDELDFFIAFSSVSAMVPSLAAGVLDYAAANASMEIYGERARMAGASKISTVAWPAWKESAISSAVIAACEKVGLGLLETQPGLAILDRLLGEQSAATLLVVPHGTSASDAEALLRVGRHSHASSGKRLERGQTPSPPRLLGWLVQVFSDELSIPLDDLDPSATFSDLGVESVMLAELVRKIEARVQRPISPSLLLEHPTLERLSAQLAEAAPSEAIPPPGPTELETAEAAPAHPKTSSQHSPRRSTSSKFPDDAIAVLGAGARFPGAPTVDDFWNNLVAARCAISEVPRERWNISELYDPHFRAGASTSKWGGFVDQLPDFDHRYFEMSRDEATRTDPAIRLFLEAVVASLADAGYARSELRGSQTSVFVGARLSSYRRRIPTAQGTAPLGGDQNFVAARVAHFLDWHGANLVVDSACSSALVAVKLACQSLLQGESELAVAGGVEILLDEEPYVEFSAARALSPTGRCKAFDHSADGFVPGEGCGAILLKPLAAAMRDGDRIRAVIRGVAVNNDGATMGLTTPNPAAQTDVVRRALRASGVSADAVEMLEAHGTATMIGDPIELQALTSAFREATSRNGFCALGSVKSNLGHLLTAAGIAGLMKAILAVERGRIPPTLFCDDPNPRFDFGVSPFFPNRTLRDWNTAPGNRIAGVSAFGLGGTNAHVIVSGLPEDLRAAESAIRTSLPAPLFTRTRCWLDRPPRTAVVSQRTGPIQRSYDNGFAFESDASILQLHFDKPSPYA